MKTKKDLKKDSLNNLPIDLVHIILNQLPTYTFLSIVSTNKKLAQLAKNEELVFKRSRVFIALMQRAFDELLREQDLVYDEYGPNHQEVADKYKARFVSLMQRLIANKIKGVDEFLSDKGHLNSNRFFQNHPSFPRSNQHLGEHLLIALGIFLGGSLILACIFSAIFAVTLTMPLSLTLTLSLSCGIGALIGLISCISLHLQAISPPNDNISVIEELIKEKPVAVMTPI
ncbi:MAG: F-box protein [Tatlockia sp.]|nr:F-box protein [Tatlockia sp.]